MKKEIIDPRDQADHEMGLEIIRLLRLSRKRDNKRIDTVTGDKTPCGLARMLRRLTASPLEKAAPDLLVAFQCLAEKTKRANDIQHSGVEIQSEDWSELYKLTNEAFAVLAKAKRGGEG